MGATGHFSQIGLNRFAPALGHAAADHALHGLQGSGAALDGVGIHGRFNGVDDQARIHGHADVHVVNGLTGTEDAAAQPGNIHGLGVDQLPFYIPQAIAALKALVAHAADVAGLAVNRRGR